MKGVNTLATMLAILLGTGQVVQAQEDKKKLSDGIVRFQTGSAEITDESAAILDRVAAFLKKQREGDILIVGHTDGNGSDAANRALSRRRAQVVKGELIKRGLAAVRLQVLGVGFAEPLSEEKTAASDALNRRVELWVGTREAVAYVSWIYRDVEAQKPAAVDWSKASVKMELRKLFRVRTVGDSASEVTFTKGSRLYLGPEAMVVIYGRGGGRRIKKKRVADVSIEEGSILARLGKKDTAPLTVETPATRVRVKSKRTRVSANRKRKQSTVSVYDGRADVSARGKSVGVLEGFGTRVKRGAVPDAPTPLPPPPVLKSLLKISSFAGDGIALSWQATATTGETLVELAARRDTKFVRPQRSWRTDQQALQITDLGPGLYWARVTTIDKKGIVGTPSEAVPVEILPAPTKTGGGALPRTGEVFQLDRPGTFDLHTKGDGFVAQLELSGKAVSLPMMVGPGLHKFRVRLVDASGREIDNFPLHVRVSPLVLTILTAVDGSLEFELKDRSGVPIDGLELFARPDIVTASVAKVGATIPMNAYAGDAKSGQPIASAGGGRYRASLAGTPKRVFVLDPNASAGVGIAMGRAPIAAPPPPQARRWRFVTGAMGGVQFKDGAVDPLFAIHAGFAWEFENRLDFGASAEFSLVTQDYDVGRLRQFPILLRGDLGYSVGRFRPYLGGSIGVRIVSKVDLAEDLEFDTGQTAFNVFGGLGVEATEVFEIHVEGRWGPTKIQGRSLPVDDDFGAPAVLGGLRARF